MKVFDMCNNNKVVLDVVLSQQQGEQYANTQDFWTQHKESIYYSIIIDQTIQFTKFHLLSKETKVVSES